MSRSNDVLAWVEGVAAEEQTPEDRFQVSVVVPLREEAREVGKVMTRIGRFLRTARWTAEVIAVDDGSEDGTAEAAARWKRHVPHLSVVRHGRPQGRGTAARTGVLLSHGTYVVLIDARGETPLQDAVPLVEYLAGGADVAIASRRVPGAEAPQAGSFLDRASETTLIALSKLLVPVEVRDTSSELQAYRRPAARDIAQRARVKGDAFSYEWLALATRLGLQMVEVPVSWLDGSETAQRRRPNELGMLRDVWRLRRRLGQEAALPTRPVHDLLHETRYMRVDRGVLMAGQAGRRGAR